MLHRLVLKLKRDSILKKIMWTLFIIFIYMIGLNIPLFTVPVNSEIFTDATLRSIMLSVSTVSGAKLSNLTLFTLGLSPWMTSQILWRGLTLLRLPIFENMTKTARDRSRFVLMVLIAVLQSYSLLISSTFVERVSIAGYDTTSLYRLISILILTTGGVLLSWLATVNAIKGVGGATVILLAHMILNFMTNLYSVLFEEENTPLSFTIKLVSIIIMFILTTIIVIYTYRSEYRIAIKRTSVHNTYTEDTYIPIRINPAGAMPFMYGMTLLIYPPLIFSTLLNFFPEQPLLIYLSQNTSVSTLPGVMIYIFMLYILSIGFTYFNYDPESIAQNMRESGDYIEHIRPGYATQQFLQRKIKAMSQIGAVIVCFTAGFPLLFVVWMGENSNLGFIIGNLFVVVSLLLMVKEQLDTLRVFKKYTPILEINNKEDR